MKNTTIILALALSTFVFCGASCKQQIAPATIKTEGVIVTTVDAGMKGWALYVNQGKATQEQVDTVKNIYDTYYNSQLAAEAALTAYIASGSTNQTDIFTVSSNAAFAESQLLAILSQYIK